MARKSHAHFMVVSRKVPKSPSSPKACPHAVRVDQPGPSLFVAQLLPLEPPKGTIHQGPMRKQADLIFAHLRQVVLEAGFTLDQVTQVTLYLTSLKHMAIVDELWGKLFFTLAQPARTVLCVQALPDDALISLDAVAVKVSDAQALMPQAPPQAADDEEMY